MIIKILNKDWRLVVFIMVLLCPNHIHAQFGGGKGQVSGKVIDEADKPVAHADIQIIWQGELRVIRRTTTDNNGRFRFTGLGSGYWEIWVSAKGYERINTRIQLRQLVKGSEIRIILRKLTEMQLKELLKGSSNLLKEGHQLFDAGKYNEARVLYTRILKQQPELFQIYIFIGDCYKAVGAHERAMEEYLKIMDIIDQMPPAVKANLYRALGDLYLHRENAKTATIYFDQALQWDPDPNQCYRLGEAFMNMDQAEEAIYYFKQAAALKKDWSDPYLKLGYIYLNSGEPKVAVDNFERFLELSSNTSHKAAIKVLIKKLSKTLD
jgi:tetratricopeptide (TPR) repeat protein